MASEPTTLDPAKVQDVDTTDLLGNVFEGLVAYDEENKIAGRLAESWSSPDSGKTWIFKLRHGVKFTNGREAVADDVKWSFERACSKSMASPTASNYLTNIVGVEDEIAGKTNTISGIKVLDPYTLQITLDQPRPYFIGMITYPCAAVLAKEASGTGQIDDIAAAVGIGPFRITKYDHGQQVVLEPNKDYYLGAAKLTKIVRPIMGDSSTRLNSYQAGDLDMLTLERQDLKGVIQSPELKAQLSYQNRPAVFYIGLNENTYAPFKNRDVRRAFAMAIDRTRICKEIMEDVPEAHGLVTPGIMGYREDYQGIPYDPVGAQKVLAAAGYPGGKGLPPLHIVYRATTPGSQRVCEAVESSLRQNLNFPVKLQSLDWSAFLDARNKGKLEGYFLSWYADYLDPQNFLSFLLSSTARLNRDGYKNAEFDRLCQTADTTLNEADRIKNYQQAEDVAIQDGARVPLYFQRDALLISPRIKGLRSNLFGQMPHTMVTAD